MMCRAQYSQFERGPESGTGLVKDFGVANFETPVIIFRGVRYGCLQHIVEISVR